LVLGGCWRGRRSGDERVEGDKRDEGEEGVEGDKRDEREEGVEGDKRDEREEGDFETKELKVLMHTVRYYT
jgi:hypothetical protein